MKKILLSWLGLAFALTVFGQVGFQKGYIVTPAGDTSTGFLKRNTYAELAHSVVFRSASNASSVFYTPENLRAFGFENSDLFEAVRYKDPTDSNKQKREFARLVLEGRYNVYALARGLVSNFLVRSNDTTYVLYDDVQTNMGQPQQMGNYRNELAFLARNCGIENTEFEKLLFSERTVVNMIYQINECNQSYSVVRHAASKFQRRVVVYGGGFAINDKWSQLALGADLRIRNIILSRKLWFVTGLHYSRTTDITKKYDSNAPGTAVRTTFINEVYSIPALLHYILFEGAVQPYVYAGVGAAFKNANYGGAEVFNKGLQGKYGLSMIGGFGIEVFPVSFIAIKADWRYELLMQHPTLGVAFRF